MFGFEMTEADRRVYEEELAPFLPEHMIDVHAHLWKKEHDHHQEAKGCVTWTQLVAEECTMEDLQQTYRDLFPNQCVKPVLMGYPVVDLAGTNAYAQACAAKAGLPVLYCTHSSQSAEEVERAVKEGGYCGLKPYLSNAPAYIPGSEVRIFDFLPPEHLELANRYGWIVMLHISRPGRLRDPLNIAQLMQIEERWPNVKLIVAHVGRAYSKEDLGDAFQTLKHTQHMMFDFTANTLDLAMEQCIEAVGTGRLMFGSDLPITKMRMYRITENGIYYNVVPRGLYGDVSSDPHMRETDEPGLTNFLYEELRAFRRCAQKLALNKKEVADILCGNAAKLFGIRF